MTASPKNQAITLSIVIPAYNEAKRILPYLQHITVYLGQRGRPYEILVVDDGSQDDTAVIVERLQSQRQVIRLIRLPTNRGKGHAVRTGMQQAQGELRLMADADGATPIQELERLETAIHNGADLAIGSRPLAYRDARYKVRVRWHRSVSGNLFNRLVQRLGIPGIRDTQCGFKLFRASVAQDLFAVSCIDGYGFDLELLYIAQRRGYKIAEVPLNWSDQPGSKVLVLRDGLRMFRELLTVRQNNKAGRYHKISRFDCKT